MKNMNKNNVKVVAAIVNAAKMESVGSPKFWELYGELQGMAMAGDSLAEAAMNRLLGVSSSADAELLSAIR